MGNVVAGVCDLGNIVMSWSEARAVGKRADFRKVDREFSVLVGYVYEITRTIWICHSTLRMLALFVAEVMIWSSLSLMFVASRKEIDRRYSDDEGCTVDRESPEWVIVCFDMGTAMSRTHKSQGQRAGKVFSGRPEFKCWSVQKRPTIAFSSGWLKPEDCCLLRLLQLRLLTVSLWSNAHHGPCPLLLCNNLIYLFIWRR